MKFVYNTIYCCYNRTDIKIKNSPKVSRPPPPPVVLVPPDQLPGHLARPLPALVGHVLRGLAQPGGEGGHQAGAQHLEAGREEVEEGGGQTEQQQHHLRYQNIIINNININKRTITIVSQG